MFYEKVKDSIVLYLHKIRSEENRFQMNEMLTFHSNTFLNKINNKDSREAKIYIQSLGRNTFITVSLNLSLIHI